MREARCKYRGRRHVGSSGVLTRNEGSQTKMCGTGKSTGLQNEVGRSSTRITRYIPAALQCACRQGIAPEMCQWYLTFLLPAETVLLRSLLFTGWKSAAFWEISEVCPFLR